MQVDKEFLMKHRFWILLGVDVPLVLIAYLIIVFSVSSVISAEAAKVETAKKDLRGISNPKNDKWVKAAATRADNVTGKQNDVWGRAWQAQDGLMTWPAEMTPKYGRAYFGDPIDPKDLADYASRWYKKQLQEVVDMPQPTNELRPPQVLVQYKGNSYEGILRFIDWNKEIPPSTEEAWLAQEDLWVQRELLRIIRDANESFATFKDVTDAGSKPAQPAADKKDDKAAAPADAAKEAAPADKDKADKEKVEKDKAPAAPAPDAAAADKKDDKNGEKKAEKAEAPKAAPAKPAAKVDMTHRRFANPYWELDLRLERNDKKQQVLRGTIKNRTKIRQPLTGLFFRVQVQPKSNLRAYIMVDREPLAAGESVPIGTGNLTESSSIDELAPEGIFAVEQVLNWQTAPVKRIDRLGMGPTGQSHRLVRNLKAPLWLKAEEKTETAASPPPGAGGDPRGGMGGPGGSMMPGGGSDDSLTVPNGLVKRRYIDASEQVRRMPVGMVVIVDQAHIEDFLTAFANSRLRIQTTLINAQHFRENIKPREEGGPVGGGVPGSASGEPQPRPPTAVGGPGSGPRGGGMGITGIGGIQAPGGGSMGGPPRGYGQGTMPGLQMPGYMGQPGMMGQRPTDEEEDMNLVELAVYGIASLYERFPQKQQTPEAANPTTPAAK
jgi:hypothetical protein